MSEQDITSEVLNTLAGENISPEAQEQLSLLLNEILNQTGSIVEIVPILSEFINEVSKILPESVASEIMPVSPEKALSDALLYILKSVEFSVSTGSYAIVDTLNITELISNIGLRIFDRIRFLFNYAGKELVELIVDILNREKFIDLGIRDAILKGIPEYTGELAEAVIEAMRLLFQSIGSAMLTITSADSYPIQNRVLNQLNVIESQLYKLIDFVEDTLEGEKLSLEELNVLSRLMEIFIVLLVGVIELLVELLIYLVVFSILITIDSTKAVSYILTSVYNLIKGFLLRDRLLSIGIREGFANLLVSSIEGSMQFFYVLFEQLSLQLIDAVKDVLPEVIQIVQGWIVALTSFTGGVATIGTSLAEQGIRYFPEFLRQIVPILIDFMGKMLQLTLNLVFTLVRFAFQSILQLISQLPAILINSLGSIVGILQKFIGSIFNFLPSILNIIPRLGGILIPS